MSKVIGIQPDIIPIRDADPEPVFDLVLGIETLTRLGVIKDFSKNCHFRPNHQCHKVIRVF